MISLASRLSLPVLAIAALAAAHIFDPAPIFSQTVRGRVVLGESERPVAGAVVEAWDSAFVRRGVARSNRRGEFELKLQGAGRYLIQAVRDGIRSPLSEPIEVGEREVRTGLRIVLVSPLEALVAGCGRGGEGDEAVLVGVVYERAHQVVLPAASIVVEWGGEGAGVGEREELGERGVRIARTDDGGRYHFCDLPVGVELTLSVEALGGEKAELLLTLPPVSLARADLEVDLGLGAGRLSLTERVPRPALGKESALSGVLVDDASGEAVVGAVVRVGGRSGVTDAAGRFTLERLAAGAQVLEVEHVAYGRWTEALELGAGAESVVRGELEARPIALGALEVEAEQRREVLSPRVSVTSRRVIRGADLAEAQRRGAQVAGLIRERFPGLSVMELTSAGMTTGICVESNRRIMSLSPSQVSGCDMVPIVIDGMQIQDASTYLRHLWDAGRRRRWRAGDLDAGARAVGERAEGAAVVAMIHCARRLRAQANYAKIRGIQPICRIPVPLTIRGLVQHARIAFRSRLHRTLPLALSRRGRRHPARLLARRPPGGGPAGSGGRRRAGQRRGLL